MLFCTGIYSVWRRLGPRLSRRMPIAGADHRQVPKTYTSNKGGRRVAGQRSGKLIEILYPLSLALFGNAASQLEGLARGEIERLVGEIDAANESVKLAQDELLAAQVTMKRRQNFDGLLRVFIYRIFGTIPVFSMIFLATNIFFATNALDGLAS